MIESLVLAVSPSSPVSVLAQTLFNSSALSKASDFPEAIAWCDGLYNLLSSKKFVYNKRPREPPHLSLKKFNQAWSLYSQYG